MTPATSDPRAPWPALALEDWIDTKQTFHRYVQVVGKVRLATMPFRNHWWHATLYVDTRGLTTGPIPTADGRRFEIAFDLVEHRLAVLASDGRVESFALADGLACKDFYAQLFASLERVGVKVAIRPAPFDLEGPLLSEDREHHSYDARALERFWTILRQVDGALNEFAGRFSGKQSPAQFFWHSFDLAQARFSGRPAPPRPGADRVSAEAYSHEVIAFGFWPGDDRVPHPAFYSYTAPAPAGLAERPLRPAAASWDPESGSAYLAYDAVRQSDDPRATLLEFFASAYIAGAGAAGWDLAAFGPKGAAERAAP